MPQPEQAAVGSDTEAPMSTGHGHHAGARAPGSRLLGDDASTGAKELPAPERWINASIEDHPAGAAMQVAQTYTLAFAVEAEAASNLDAGGSARSELRSEEHTSELQSLMRTSYAVFCLKKKTNKRQ